MSQDAQEIRAALLLSRLPGVGAAAFRRLITRYKTPSAALEAAPHGFAERAKADTQAGLQRAESFLEKGGKVLYWGGPEYPARLAALGEPPPVLFVRGDLAALSGQTLSVVGSRQLDAPGQAASYGAAAACVSAGFSIVSGGARGVDGLAHQAALDLGGRTVVVLGCGIDVVYPPEHQVLFQSVVESGGLLLSELLPGAPPMGGFFATRNRIIAALGSALLITRAGPTSGALRTARWAKRLERPVAAMLARGPEMLDAGCRHVIHEGGEALRSPAELIRWLASLRPLTPSQSMVRACRM